MNNSMSCSGGRWCTRADALLGVEGVHVSSVTATPGGLILGVGTGEDVTGCPRRTANHDVACWTGSSVVVIDDFDVVRDVSCASIRRADSEHPSTDAWLIAAMRDFIEFA